MFRIFILFLAQFLVTGAIAGDEDERIMTVGLSVEADDLVDRLTSCVRKELRSFGDIEVVAYEEAEFWIDFLFMKSSNQGGTKTGYFGSWIVRERISSPEEMASYKSLYPNWGKDGDFLAVSWTGMYKSGVSFLQDMQILAVPLDGATQHICENAVAAFDMKAAEPRRQSWKYVDAARGSPDFGQEDE